MLNGRASSKQAYVGNSTRADGVESKHVERRRETRFIGSGPPNVSRVFAASISSIFCFFRTFTKCTLSVEEADVRRQNVQQTEVCGSAEQASVPMQTKAPFVDTKTSRCLYVTVTIVRCQHVMMTTLKTGASSTSAMEE